MKNQLPEKISFIHLIGLFQYSNEHRQKLILKIFPEDWLSLATQAQKVEKSNIQYDILFFKYPGILYGSVNTNWYP